ncbi:hypothetical protein C8R48DRAFT_768034 [Suillus tomentosus]|nr:hypothetical protein C8R48DRAFT_768034 [Suillus tomentosus]
MSALYFRSVTVDEKLQIAGSESFDKLERRIKNFDKELRNFANAARQLGSSIGILSSSFRLRERLAKLLFLFRENAATLFPRKISHQPRETPIVHQWTEQRRTEKQMFPKAHPGPECFPDQISSFSEDVITFLNCLNEFPEFTDEAVNTSMRTFECDLKYWASCLQEYKGQFRYPAVQRYIHDLTSEIGEHIDIITVNLSMFIEIGVPTIRFAQQHAASNLLNLSTVATFFSVVTTSTLQLSYQLTDGVLETFVNAFWFSSLVFSIAAAVNSLAIKYFLWVLIWIKRSPLVFLMMYGIYSTPDIRDITYTQGFVTSTITTIFTAITSFGLAVVSAWFVSERRVFVRYHGPIWLDDAINEAIYRVLHFSLVVAMRDVIRWCLFAISGLLRRVLLKFPELLEGKPPYHFLDPMPALFRIVQDDCPPIPDGASPIVKDFLLHCFQKDCNLRISAKKLLRHPWMISAKRQMNMAVGNGQRSPEGGPQSFPDSRRPQSNYSYDEAVLKVQEWNEALKSPTRPTKKHCRNSVSEGQPPSPTVASTSGNSVLKGPNIAPGKPSAPVALVEKIREPLAFVLQPPEEQTDNWDDDFEDGPSFTKLQEKTSTEDEKAEGDDNAQTIRPNHSPAGPGTIPLARAPSADIVPIVEDYSDITTEEDELLFQEKVADFKMKNSVRRGLFHPDDIKVLGLLSGSPGPMSAPLPSLSRKASRPSLSPISGMGLPPTGSIRSHSRSSSFVGSSSSASGSFGRAEAKRAASHANLASMLRKTMRTTMISLENLAELLRSSRAADADLATQHKIVEQVMARRRFGRRRSFRSMITRIGHRDCMLPTIQEGPPMDDLSHHRDISTSTCPAFTEHPTSIKGLASEDSEPSHPVIALSVSVELCALSS